MVGDIYVDTKVLYDYIDQRMKITEGMIKEYREDTVEHILRLEEKVDNSIKTIYDTKEKGVVNRIFIDSLTKDVNEIKANVTVAKIELIKAVVPKLLLGVTIYGLGLISSASGMHLNVGDIVSMFK